MAPLRPRDTCETDPRDQHCSSIRWKEGRGTLDSGLISHMELSWSKLFNYVNEVRRSESVWRIFFFLQGISSSTFHSADVTYFWFSDFWLRMAVEMLWGLLPSPLFYADSHDSNLNWITMSTRSTCARGRLLILPWFAFEHLQLKLPSASVENELQSSIAKSDNTSCGVKYFETKQMLTQRALHFTLPPFILTRIIRGSCSCYLQKPNVLRCFGCFSSKSWFWAAGEWRQQFCRGCLSNKHLNKSTLVFALEFARVAATSEARMN